MSISTLNCLFSIDTNLHYILAVLGTAHSMTDIRQMDMFSENYNQVTVQTIDLDESKKSVI